MKWIQITPYCLKSGDWTIAKYNLAIGVKYGLYHFNDSKGFYTTSNEAKQKALEIKND